jgi:hypothetical protein
MRCIPLVLGALLLQVPAKADKFWLVDPEVAKTAAEGSSPNVIEGVLLAENEDGYHIRVVGGEVVLAKASVFKIEKDALTLAAVLEAEKAGADALAAADRERQMAQAAARRARDVRVAEAAARRSAIPAEATATPAARPAEATFDPILDRAAAGAEATGDMLANLQLAWEMTRDRRYLKALRQLRRLR